LERFPDELRTAPLASRKRRLVQSLSGSASGFAAEHATGMHILGHDDDDEALDVDSIITPTAV
jgi:hypothetical protein